MMWRPLLRRPCPMTRDPGKGSQANLWARERWLALSVSSCPASLRLPVSTNKKSYRRDIWSHQRIGNTAYESCTRIRSWSSSTAPRSKVSSKLQNPNSKTVPLMLNDVTRFVFISPSNLISWHRQRAECGVGQRGPKGTRRQNEG